MNATPDGSLQLTYCTNIHPGNGWEAVLGSLRRYVLPLKERLSPDAPFGIGLRLSADESEELSAGEPLWQFRRFLDDHGLYVAILNGFPYGRFHHARIKEDVFAPDWRSPERVDYTLRLAKILRELLPEGMDGGISTSPLSYKGWVSPDDAAAWESITRNVVRVAEALAIVHRESGRRIHLDIEPEPNGLIENSEETVAFFRDRLLPTGVPHLADVLEVSPDDAARALLDHVQVCYDTCHFAVEYETPAQALETLRRAGVGIGRAQISSALRIPLPDDPARRDDLARRLAPFAESTYLHQVIERRADGGLRRYPDLPDALPSIGEPGAREWRIHFHVPLFVGTYGDFGSTVEDNRAALRLLMDEPITRHLEIETYTWDVLPGPLKVDLLESIGREFAWVLGELGAPSG
jgi:sugar phosphate isomerase/epimerase